MNTPDTQSVPHSSRNDSFGTSVPVTAHESPERHEPQNDEVAASEFSLADQSRG